MSRPWAICEGGLIQDSSDDVETTDLDWLDSNGEPDRDEVERSWVLLNRVVAEGNVGWADYLVRVADVLKEIYERDEVDPEQFVWNESPIVEGEPG